MDNKIERMKMVKAMEFIARQINNEEIFNEWLMDGVADGDIEYGNLDVSAVYEEDYMISDEGFKDIMSTFLICMKNAYTSGGLYCDGIVSRTKGE